VVSFEMQLILGTKYLNGYNTGARYSGTFSGHVFYSVEYADDSHMLAIVPQLTYMSRAAKSNCLGERRNFAVDGCSTDEYS